jgi:hypothetical protein
VKKQVSPELTVDFRQALEHFIAAGREMLLAGEALLEVGIKMADKFLEDRPASQASEKAGPAKKVHVE